jgi:hypothetical protein
MDRPTLDDLFNKADPRERAEFDTRWRPLLLQENVDLATLHELSFDEIENDLHIKAFGDQRRFAKCLKALFGVTPRWYSQQRKRRSSNNDGNHGAVGKIHAGSAAWEMADGMETPRAISNLVLLQSTLGLRNQ